MKSKLILILLFVSLVYSQDKQLEITYIANMGYMIKSPNHKVLIDGLFGEKELGYCDTPDSNIIQSIIDGTGDFKNTNLVIASHNHQDHYSAAFVGKFLQNNPNTTFISTLQATQELQTNEQIKSMTPDNLSTLTTTIDEVKITFYRLPHSPYMITDEFSGEKYNKHESVENVGILLEIDGVKIFHSGDSHSGSVDELTNYKLNEENIDIAILDRIFPFGGNGQEVVKNMVNPRHIIIGHINPERKEMFVKYSEKLSINYESIKVFKNEMETEVYKF